MRVLVIEDDPDLRRQLRARLNAEGMRVEATGEGREGLYLARDYPFELAVIDLGLPDLPGLEIIRQLRSEALSLPILILTARGRWQDKVEGLEAGADDYLVKPFQPEELIARLHALARRAAGSATDELHVGPLRLDRRSQRVWVEAREVVLTGYEYALLEQLVIARGGLLSKQGLTDRLYDHDEDRDSNVLEVLVGRLRRKLDPTGRLKPIQTLRGRGYRLALMDMPSDSSAVALEPSMSCRSGR